MRVVALIESSGGEEPGASVEPTAVTIRGEKEESFVLQPHGAVKDHPNVKVSVFGVEIDTSAFDPGPYDCELHLGETVVGLEDNLWILGEDDFRKLLEEELSQASAEGKSLSVKESGVGLKSSIS